MSPISPVPPCVVHEDDDILVVSKPSGWETHSTAPFSGEGILDWLKHREPRWERLAVVHDLGRHESGLLVLARTPEAHRALAAQKIRMRGAELSFRHPRTDRLVRLGPASGSAMPAHLRLRAAMIDGIATNAFRTVHGAADGTPGLYGDRLGDWQLFEGEDPPSAAAVAGARSVLPGMDPPVGIYFRQLLRHVRRSTVADASPKLVAGTAAPERFVVRENGVTFELSFNEGYSTGLFLDQRDNRRRLIHRHVAAGFPLYGNPTDTAPEVLNCFAYTCAFSVCAALGGARTTSLDLSRKYLDWGRRNFELNGLQPSSHDFIYGDVFDWLGRLLKKARAYDLILLDPPTFSRSREGGDFRAEADYGRLVTLALPLLRRRGVLLASANTARMSATSFVGQVHAAIAEAGWRIVQQHYAPQPPDFPVTREEPGYLKTIWLRLERDRESGQPA